MISRLLITLILLTSTTAVLAAQDQLPQSELTNPIEQLRLTPEQRQKIRAILAENKDERQMTNRRVREAHVALDQALDAEPTDETLIDQRVNELAAAQAAQTRMRIRTELKIRRELRPAQLATLRRLRLQVRDVMAPRRQINQRPIRQGLRPRNR